MIPTIGIGTAGVIALNAASLDLLILDSTATVIRASYRDEPRRHCHSIYDDPHGVVADRAYPRPWRR
jgi:hypothetical protein